MKTKTIFAFAWMALVSHLAFGPVESRKVGIEGSEGKFIAVTNTRVYELGLDGELREILSVAPGNPFFGASRGHVHYIGNVRDGKVVLVIRFDDRDDRHFPVILNVFTGEAEVIRETNTAWSVNWSGLGTLSVGFSIDGNSPDVVVRRFDLNRRKFLSGSKIVPTDSLYGDDLAARLPDGGSATLLGSVGIETSSGYALSIRASEGSEAREIPLKGLDEREGIRAIRYASPLGANIQNKLFGLGDSVAAAYGLGPDGNTSSYPEQVLAHWGASRDYTGDNFAVSGATSSDVLTKQLPQIINQNPSLVLLTAGADDIRHAQCAKAYFLPGEENPCLGDTFTKALIGLETNLKYIFGALEKSKVLVTEYYNPFPGPAGPFEEVCDIYYVPGLLASSTHILVDPVFTTASARLLAVASQNRIAEYSSGVVNRLNTAIREAANGFSNVTVVEIDSLFAGHDACKDAGAAWVFGFEGDLNVHFTGWTQEFTYSMPFSCPDQTRDPALLDKKTPRYEIHLLINCTPHPTFEGQSALADAVIAALP